MPWLLVWHRVYPKGRCLQDDGTFGDDGEGQAVAASPGSVSLGTDSSKDEDDEDGDAAEHRMNVRTGWQPEV